METEAQDAEWNPVTHPDTTEHTHPGGAPARSTGRPRGGAGGAGPGGSDPASHRAHAGLHKGSGSG